MPNYQRVNSLCNGNLNDSLEIEKKLMRVDNYNHNIICIVIYILNIII